MDVAGFDAAMAEQKAKARAAWSGSGETADAAVWFDLAEEHGATEFLGYDTEKRRGADRWRWSATAQRSTRPRGDEVQIVVNQTPFYAESGGQVGDHGRIRTDDRRWREVTDTKKAAGVFIHMAEVTEGHDREGPAGPAGGRSRAPGRDPGEPFGDASSARGAAARAGRPCRAARQS